MMRPVLFLTGPHASGKTELARHLLDSHGYSYVDLGPSIRAAHKTQRPEMDFKDWLTQGEKEFGPNFTNRVVADAALRSLESSPGEKPFIVIGSRSYPGLRYLVNALDAENKRIMYIEADAAAMYERYKMRESNPDLIAEEFQAILIKDRLMGLEGIRDHAAWAVNNSGSLESFHSSATELIYHWLNKQ